MFSVIYYSDNHCSPVILKTCLTNLQNTLSEFDAELIIQIQNTPNERSHHLMYQNILSGLEKASHRTIFLAEHDVLYTRWHFFNRPDDATLLYNINTLNLTRQGYIIDNNYKLSQLSGRKLVIQKAIELKLAQKEIIVAEPIEPPMIFSTYISGASNVDIRHKHAFTGDRESEIIRINDRYWGPATSLIRSLEL